MNFARQALAALLVAAQPRAERLAKMPWLAHREL